MNMTDDIACLIMKLILYDKNELLLLLLLLFCYLILVMNTYTLDILFCQITTFIKVGVAFAFGLQTL